MKPTLVHISNDYPDPLYPDKTQAIKNLVEATPEFRHVVYSLFRTSGLFGIASIPFGEDRTAVTYRALSKGILWKRRMEDIAGWIYDDLQAKHITPDLIQAHKITVEGMAGYALAERFGCPLICDIQGGTDVRILRAKPNLHNHYRTIAERSSCIFPYAPWVIPAFEKHIGLERSKCVNLPVLPGFDTLQPSTSRNTRRLVTLMRFDDRTNKNLSGTMAAMKQLTGRYPELALDIYGGGSPEGLLELTKKTKEKGLVGRVHFKGPIANKVLISTLGNYTALVMPSFMETYGLVYAEALLCGLPVMYSRGRAIDGYFNPDDIGYACDPTSVEDIATGIDHMLKHEDSLKVSIASMQQRGKLDVIRRPAIIESYKETILRIVA